MTPGLRNIAIVICRRDGPGGRREFLMVQERKFGEAWYFPAGGVDEGERFLEAARREAREEAGLEVTLTGVLRVEHRVGPPDRWRVFFAAAPLDATAAPKSAPDEHTLRAAWLTVDEIRRLSLRGDEVLAVLDAVERGAPVHPLALLVTAGEPWA